MSFDILNRSLNLSRSYFLEASAGTGKTFAIEQLVVRLLLEREEALSIRQILAVTFTRDAVRDMKARIRENLEKIADNLREKKNALNFDYLTALLEKGELPVQEALRRVEEALLCFDEVQIFTIHGFCEKMLCEFAFEAQLGFSYVEHQSARTLMKRAAKDFFRTTLSRHAYGKRQIEKLLRKHNFNVERLTNAFVNAEPSETSSSFSEVFKEFNEKLTQFSCSAESFVEEFRRVAPSYKGVSGEETMTQVKALAALVEKRQCSSEEFDELLKDKEWFLEKFTADNLKKKAQEIPSALFETMQRELLPLLQAASDKEKIFERMSAEYQQFWAEQKEKRNVFTHDGILEKMERAVMSPAFCQKVGERYSVAIVDEFQDTDALQWKILKQLFHDKQLFFVGDPKQSIYGFRKADLNTYFKAAKNIANGERHFLDKNFRSHHTLVAALNALFATPNWLGHEELIYRAVTPKEKESSYKIEDDKGAVHFFLAEATFGKERRWPTKAIEQDYFFPFIAAEIHKLGVPLAEVAILVKDRYQAERLQAYLRKCHLPAAVKKTLNLSETPAFLGMKQLIEAVLFPKTLLSLLAGPLIAWNHQEIRSIAPEKLTSLQSTLSELYTILEEKGFGPFFDAFLRTGLVKMDDDLKQIAALLMEEAAPTQELLLFLQELEKRDLEEEPRLKRQEGEEAQSVQIMTMHASKGLEFEIVFALGLASRQWTDSEDEEQITASDIEKMRLLYVALTRAKTRVYVPFAFDLDQKQPAPGTRSAIELFCAQLGDCSTSTSLTAILKRFEHVSSALLEKMAPPSLERELEQQESVPSKLALPSFASKMLLSFSSLAAAHVPKREEKLLPSERSAHALPMGSETGTLLHRILEKSIETRLYTLHDLSALRALVSRELKRTQLEEWADVVTELIEGILRLPLNKEICLASVPPENLMQEMEFLFSPRQEFIKGFVDLVFLMEGKYYVLDWKSNWLGSSDADYGEERIKEVMRENDYFLQASIYASALQHYVKLFDNRPFEDCFGGTLYIFLRGKAVYSFFPEPLKEIL